MLYIALGDSITIDDYPDQELGSKGNGAASLLAKKLDGCTFLNLSKDGATIKDIADHQIPVALKAARKHKEILITLTAGGNDISFKSMRLAAQRIDEQGSRFGDMVDDIVRDYVNLVMYIKKNFPEHFLILNTLYDPTDGTGTLPENCGLWADIAPMYSRGRRLLGNFIRGWGKNLRNTEVVDIFQIFKDKGMLINNKEGMYYDNFLIEPGSVGAKAIADWWYMAFLDSPLVNKPEEIVR